MAGSNVEPGMMLFEVADLSAVWVEADVYEKDIAALRPGQTVEAAVEAIPNRTFHGKLALVYPQPRCGHADQPRPLRVGQPRRPTAARHVRHGDDRRATGRRRVSLSPCPSGR